MKELVIDLVRGPGGSLAARYLQEHPDVADALRQGGGRVVVFEMAHRAAPQVFFEAMQRALSAAETMVPSEVRPVFVALTSVPQLKATDAFNIGKRPGVPWTRVEPGRGVFLGYLAIGEGGVVLFDATGDCHGSEPPGKLVLAALR